MILVIIIDVLVVPFENLDFNNLTTVSSNEIRLSGRQHEMHISTVGTFVIFLMIFLLN